MLTLRESGCATVGMVTGYPRAEAYSAFRVPGRFLMDGPVFTRSRLVSIHGRDRVRSAVVENVDSGKRTTVNSDTVVFTGDRLPDHEHRDEAPKAVRIRTDGPFRWVAPQLVSPEGGVAARGDLLFWVDEYRRLPKLRAIQDGRTLATKRTPWPAAPGRVYRAPWSLVANADPAGGDVTVSFA